jgi:hypothetical protein
MDLQSIQNEASCGTEQNAPYADPVEFSSQKRLRTAPHSIPETVCGGEDKESRNPDNQEKEETSEKRRRDISQKMLELSPESPPVQVFPPP